MRFSFILIHIFICITNSETLPNVQPVAVTDLKNEDHMPWNVQFFSQWCGVLNDATGKAQLCYQRYEDDMREAAESYCCPNWKLADCLINNVAPGCEKDKRRSLVDFWTEYFEQSNECPTFRSYLEGSMPASCAWYFHKGMIIGWIFGALALVLVVTGVTILIIRLKKRRQEESTEPKTG